MKGVGEGGNMSKVHDEGVPAAREIIVRAVYGRCTHQVWQTVSVSPVQGKPSAILGAVAGPLRIKNVSISPADEQTTVTVEAATGVHVWYQGSDDTFVARETAAFREEFSVRPVAPGKYVRCAADVSSAGPPRCGEWRLLADGRVLVDLETTVEVEVTGETRLRVAVAPDSATGSSTAEPLRTGEASSPAATASGPEASAGPLEAAEEDD